MENLQKQLCIFIINISWHEKNQNIISTAKIFSLALLGWVFCQGFMLCQVVIWFQLFPIPPQRITCILLNDEDYPSSCKMLI